jgi:hypothetical protein
MADLKGIYRNKSIAGLIGAYKICLNQSFLLQVKTGQLGNVTAAAIKRIHFFRFHFY